LHFVTVALTRRSTTIRGTKHALSLEAAQFCTKGKTMKIKMLADAVCDGALHHKNDVVTASLPEARRLIAAQLAMVSVHANSAPGVIIE